MNEYDKAKTKAEAGEWLNAEDCTILLDVSRATFYNRVRDGLIGHVPQTPGSKNRKYSPVDVLRLLADAQVVRFSGAPEA